MLNATTILVTAATLLLLIAAWFYLRFFYIDHAAIDGLPEPSTNSLIYGHLRLLGTDHATTLEKWAIRNGWPIFQVRLGYRRVIVLNGFDAARDWLVTNQAATIDRPEFYTFHKIVSKTSGG